MNSASRAVPVNQSIETVLLPLSADASLAGTCGSLLGIRPLSQHPTSRHRVQEDKSSEPQAVRKSVSFSLRVRGPGAGYNSPVPEQQQPPSPQCCPDSSNPPQQQGTPSGGPEAANEAVVRRLFRAVQGHASSPEPQPKAYPGWIPQPQHNKLTAWAEPTLVQDFQPASNPTTAIGPSQSNSTTWTSTGQAPDPVGSKEAGLSGSSLNAHALARARLAVGCTSHVGYPLTSFPPGPAGLAAGIHGDGWPPLLGREVRSPSPKWAMPRHASAILQQEAHQRSEPHPGQQRTARQHPQLPLEMHETVAGYPSTAVQRESGALPVPVRSTAGWESRQAPSQQAARRSMSPHRAGLRSSACSGPGRVWGQAATRTVTLGQPVQKACPRPTRTPPPAARTITQPNASTAVAPITEIGATAGLTTATAMPTRSPGMDRALTSSPEARGADAPSASVDGSPQATFEQVHLLLASLNLHGLGLTSTDADRQPMETGGDVPEEQQQRDSGGLTPAASAFTTGPAGQPSPADHWPHVSRQEGGLTRLAATSVMAEARMDLGFTHSMYRRLGAVRFGVDAFDECPSPPSPAVAMNARCAMSKADNDLDAVRWPFDQALAARGPGDPWVHELAKSGGTDPEGFLQALQPACCAWLRSVARVAAQQRQTALDEMSELMQQLQEAQLERRHVDAYLLGSRLGVLRDRLARLHELAVASGARPAVTAALLSQLEDRLRLKVALRALRRHAIGALHLQDLLQSRHEAGGPLAVAAWQCWRRAAAAREVLRSRVNAMAAARWRLQAFRVLSAWRTLVRRTGELRELGTRLRNRLAPRRAAQYLFAWRAACARGAVLRRALVACCVARMQRQLLAWRDVAREVAYSGRLHRTAERHYRSRLLLASLAHWRFLHLSRAVERVWESALARRRGLQLLARAMHVWHFYARRCRQLIRHLAWRHAAVASDTMPVVNESELPAPLALAGVAIMMQQLLSTARTYMLAMSDELLHLRSFLRFTKSTVGAPQRTTVAPEAHKTRLMPGPSIAPAPSGASGVAEASASASFPASSSSSGLSARDGKNPSAFIGADSSRTERVGDVRGGRVRASPRLLISGQWRHKRQVLVLLAELRQVERMAADVDSQLEAAEREGRIVKLGLQQRADEIQRRTATSQKAMAAARAQQQALQTDMEHLDKEVLAVGDYLDRCRAASVEVANELRCVETQLAEAEAQHQEARAAAAEATAWEASLRQSQLAKQAAAEAAAIQPPHPSFARAHQGERQGRERLLAAQRRLSEALQLKAALMVHWQETQLEAATAPRYAAQRHALRVAEAQQQVVEAAKVVSLAELEVHDLLVAVDRLTQATRDAKDAEDELQAAADAAAAQAAEAVERTAAATRETAQAAAAEQRAQGAVLALRERLREAQKMELPPTPTQGQPTLLEPLRAREEHLKAKLEGCTARAEAAQEELRAAMAEAAALSKQVEAAEVSYRAQLLRLQPARAKLQQSVHQLRSKLEAYPSELVRQLRPVVDAHGPEVVCQGTCWDRTAKLLPLGRVQEPRPGMLLAGSESETDSEPDSSAQDGGGGASPTAQCSAGQRNAGVRSSSPHPALLGGVGVGGAASMSFQLPPSAFNDLGATVSAAVRDGAGVSVVPEQQQQASSVGVASTDDQRLQQPQHGLSTAQLSRLARSVLGSATTHSDGILQDTRPARRARHGEGFAAMVAGADTDDDHDYGKACHEGVASSPPRAPSRNATVLQETGRLISLLERALGHDEDAARLVRSNGSSTATSEASGVEGEYGSAAATDFSAAGAPTARLGAYRVSQGHLLDSRHEGSSQLLPAWRPSLDGCRLASFWEMGYPEPPFHTPVIGSSGGVAGSVLERRGIGSGGDISGDEDLEQPLRPSHARRSAPASGPVAGRFSSASSVHAHFSDPDNMLPQGAKVTSKNKPGQDDNLAPTHKHQMQLQDHAAAAAKGRDIAAQAGSVLALDLDRAITPRRPRHVINCEAPNETGGAEGPGLPCSVSHSDATDAGTRTPRGLEGAAWLFNRRRLCCRTLQGFRAYAISLGSLAARLRGISGGVRLRWALASWRSAITEPKALAELVNRCNACRRCLQRWRSYVCERRQRVGLIELGRKRMWQRTLHACLGCWRMWCNDQVAKRRAAAKASAHLVRSLLLQWRRGARLSQEWRAVSSAADKLYAQAACRRCLSQWLHVLRTRQLLLRVFARAEMLWDEYPESSTYFGDEFDTLRDAFNQLQHYRVYRLDKRKQRINEQAAAAFRTSLLRVRAFAAWQAAVESARHERFVIRLAMRLLRAWRLFTREQRDVPGSLCNLRRRLRARGYLAGEADVRRQRLLRCTLAALEAHSEASYRQYARTLLSRAVRSWRLVLAEMAVLVKAHRSRTLRVLLWQWHAMTASRLRLRCACTALMARWHRRLLRLSLTAWVELIGEIRAKGYLSSAAALHYERNLALRVLHHLSSSINYSRRGWSQAVAHHASSRLRRCMLEWRVHALNTRAKTEALKRTLVSVDIHTQGVCDQLRIRHSPLPAVVTGALLPISCQPVRRQGTFAVTSIPVKAVVKANTPCMQEQKQTSLSAFSLSTPGTRYRMQEMHMSGGRTAQVLVLESESRDRELETSVLHPGDGSGAAHGHRWPDHNVPPHTCNETLRPWNSCTSDLRISCSTSHSDLAQRDSNSSPQSRVSLRDLPSDVSSMSAATLRMWRNYAQEQLAEEWWRRLILRRCLLCWRRCVYTKRRTLRHDFCKK